MIVMEAAVIAGLCSYHCKQNPFVQGFGAVGVPTKLTDAAHSYKRVNYVDSKVFVFVCVCGPLLLRVNPQNPQTKQPEFWIRFFGAGG